MASKGRQFFHYSQLEEVAAGMWRIVRGEERKRFIENAANLMRDTDRFEDAMRKAIHDWPQSCAAAFTADSINQIAWLGHAGCCIGVDSPEECTRCGWHTLNAAEQDAANAAAARALASWAGELQGDLFAPC
jgi:hypothetical protein